MADDSATDCLFERLRLHQQRSPDAMEVARALTARINSRITSHDKHVRTSTLEKLWNKQSGAVQMLVSILENSRDSTTCTYITSILREVLCLKQGKGKRCSVTNESPPGNKKKELKRTGKENKDPNKKVNNNARQLCGQHFMSINGTQVVIRTLVATHSKRDGYVGTESMLQDLIWIIAAIAPKDPKFALKVRMIGCVRTLHLILKGHFTDNKLIFPLLVIMKQLAKNNITTSILIRDGIMTTYERILVSLGFIPTARLRLCLDAIDYFSKNKVCCMQIVKTGLSGIMLRVFDRWDRYEGRMRLKVCAHILQTLQHLCNISTNGTWPCHDDEEGANSDTKTVNSDDDESPEIDPLEGIDEFPDFDTISNDIKVDPMIECNEDKNAMKLSDSIQSSIWIKPNERDLEDLKKYFIFFKEYGSYNKQIKLVKSRSNSRGSILEDFMSPHVGSSKNPYPLSHASFISTDFNNIVGPSSSFLQYNRLHESPCKYRRRENGSTVSSHTALGQDPFFNAVLFAATMSNSSLKIHKDISRYCAFQSIYATISSRVRSVIPFVKVAYPDMMGGSGLNLPEPLYKMERTACRNKLLSCVDRAINPETYMNEVVYDLDQLATNGNPNNDGVSNSPNTKSTENLLLSNSDENEISKTNSFATRLSFESRFESGNLRKAIQIGPREYELILMPDVNSNKRHQWFYFEVRHMQQGRPYIFNIVNCEKSDSQFNFGMKPVMYSVKEAILGKPGWVRAGSDICYYRNSYHYANQRSHNKCYLTVTFNIDFPHSNDVVYLAYHFPFTYSMMMARIWQWSLQMPPGSYLRAEPLCYSLNGNEIPLLTISSEDSPSNPITEREIILLTARVHPGESNASWVMDGTLSCLLGDSAVATTLRAKFVFKIVPMLNVEGVINGCHRCGLTNEDLNRRWSKPHPVLHPSIYHTKGLIEYLVRVWKKPPLVYCDYHGHSRKKNVFFYGCAAAESWCSNDRMLPDEPVKYLMLPALMHRISPAFALGTCSFRVERERESTARVTVWRHLGVTRSYTMEASFCGFDRGPFKGFHLNTQHLQSVGSDFCEALSGLNDTATSVDIQFTKDINGEIAVDSEPGSGSDSVLKTDSDEDFD